MNPLPSEMPLVAAAAAPLAPSAPRPAAGARPRFTLDGDEALEARLARVCAQVREGIAGVVPGNRLEAIILGGGYGRGEGGVLRTAGGDAPYNDLEFYVFVNEYPPLAEWRYGPALAALAHELTPAAGVEVEFKVLSLARLRRSRITMFSYDLLLGHRWVLGAEEMLAGCEHHRWAQLIPADEVTRLLLNRCTGLLFARERLQRADFSAADADFTFRNLAKVRLALGDALLAAMGRYHWSCRERHARLDRIRPARSWPWFAAVREEHRAGLEFKLRPHRSRDSRGDLQAAWQPLAELAGRLWLWAERRRLGLPFPTLVDYAMDGRGKCPGTSAAANWLRHARQLGLGALLSRRAARHPRERLLNTLPLLLWEPAALEQPAVRAQVRRALGTAATDWNGMVCAYRRLWERFR